MSSVYEIILAHTGMNLSNEVQDEVADIIWYQVQDKIWSKIYGQVQDKVNTFVRDDFMSGAQINETTW